MLREIGAVLALVTMLSPLPARADLGSARAQLQKGEYEGAIRAFGSAARGSDRGEALLGQVAALRRLGRYQEALRTARLASRIQAVAPEAKAVLGEVLIAVGRYREAIRVLAPLVGRAPKAFRARVVLGRAYEAVGENLKAGVIWRDLYRDWDNGLLDRTRADHTFYVGMAGLGDQNWQYASDAFEKAVKLDPKLFRANLVWGWLFMRKHNVPDAERCFKDVLKYDPNHPDAWAGLAWVEWYAARPKRKLGRKHAEKALATNPRHVEAMLYLASAHIYDMEYGRALILAERALKVNPASPRALAHLAAVHYLRDKKAEYRKVEARVKKVNPRFSDFYAIIARFATRHHLYAQAVSLNKQAKAMDPKNATALAALGVALLRVGSEGEGLFWLKEAWKLDKYNHQTLNLLNLYDEVEKKYVTIKSEHFRIRVPRDEAALLGRYLPRHLEGSLALYRKKYGYRPPKPITVELYENQKDFTVRTFGEPSHGGILGVCFGPVITAMSPSTGRANWAMVLHHELAHTVHIAISRARVPRWFTEGLAEYETQLARPEWQREHRLDVLRAIRHGTLAGIERLNYAFTHAKTAKGIVIAYFQSSLVIRFIAERWGYKALRRALDLFAQLKTTAEVIPAITGLTTEAFDRAFVADLRKRLAAYRKNFDPLSAVVVPLEELKERAKARPSDAAAQADLAVGYLARGKKGPGKEALAKALASDGRHPVARFLKAELAHSEKKAARARRILEALIKEGHDGYMLRMRLGELAARDKRFEAALDHYAAAKRLDPERAEVYDRRIRILERLKKKLAVVMEMIQLARLEEGNASLLYSIVIRADKLKRWDLVRRVGRQAVEIQPLNMLVHEKYAWALKAGGKHRQAIFEFESSLATIPEAMPPAKRRALEGKTAWIHLGIAECWAALRDPRRAMDSVRRVLALDSNNERALRLKRELQP